MKKFKFTILIAALFALVFLSVQSSVTVADKITTLNVEKTGSYVYITGNVPVFKAYKGYEYSSTGGECRIKIYSSLRLLGGDNKFKIHVGDFDKIYYTDSKGNTAEVK